LHPAARLVTVNFDRVTTTAIKPGSFNESLGRFVVKARAEFSKPYSFAAKPDAKVARSDASFAKPYAMNIKAPAWNVKLPAAFA